MPFGLLSEAHLAFSKLAQRFKVSPGGSREDLRLLTTIQPITNMDEVQGVPRVVQLTSAQTSGTGGIEVGAVPDGKRWKHIRGTMTVASGTLVLDAVVFKDVSEGKQITIANTADVSGELALDYGSPFWCDSGDVFKINVKTHTSAGTVRYTVLCEEYDIK